MPRSFASHKLSFLATAFLLSAPYVGIAQETLRNEVDVRQYFAEQRQAYKSAETLKDAVVIAKRRLVEEKLSEYAAIIDEGRIQDAIRNSVEWWDKQHARSEDRAKKVDSPQREKDIVAIQAKHFRESAKPKYEQIVNKTKWPSGAYFFVQGGNKPGRYGLKIDLIIDTRNEDGSGYVLGPNMPEITMHSVEILRLNYGKTNLKGTGHQFKALSANP